MQFTDTHCHLDFSELCASDTQLAELLKNCAKQQISRIFLPSISPSNWSKVIDIATKYRQQTPISPSVFMALGLHPWYIHQCEIQDLDKLEQQSASLPRAKEQDHNQEQAQTQAKTAKLIAIGEAGIDLPIADKYQNLAEQVTFFDGQIEVAQKHQLPLIVHHRRSHNLIIERLKNNKFSYGGVLHAFSGSYQQALQYIDLGFKLGIGGTITYPRAKKTINAIKRLPLSSLVLETDAPAMPLMNFQGQANSPLRLIDVFNALVEIRSEDKDSIAEQLENNVNQAFKLNNLSSG